MLVSRHKLKKFTSAVLGIAKKSVPEYSSNFSRKDFTLHQHCAMLCLKVRKKQKFRESVDLLSEMPEICNILGIEKTVDSSQGIQEH